MTYDEKGIGIGHEWRGSRILTFSHSLLILARHARQGQTGGLGLI